MITYAALSPHPPLLIPEIGGERIQDVAATVEGMQQMARELVDSYPETVVFLTPHGNVFSDAVSALSAILATIIKGRAVKMIMNCCRK